MSRMSDNRRSSRRPTNGRTVRLRPARVTDVRDLAQLEMICFHTRNETFHARQIRNLITRSKGIILVAAYKRRIIGWAVGLLRQHRHFTSGRLYAVAIHPDFRGTGLGQRLTLSILRSLSNRGARNVYLEVREDNRPAIGLYQKLGFIPRCRLPHYYAQGQHGLSMVRMTI